MRTISKWAWWRRAPYETYEEFKERTAMVKYWAFIGKKLAGPCATRDEAIALWHTKFKLDIGKQIGSGYGESNAWFDIRWTNYSYSEIKEFQKNYKKPID